MNRRCRLSNVIHDIVVLLFLYCITVIHHGPPFLSINIIQPIYLGRSHVVECYIHLFYTREAHNHRTRLLVEDFYCPYWLYRGRGLPIFVSFTNAKQIWHDMIRLHDHCSFLYYIMKLHYYIGATGEFIRLTSGPGGVSPT